MTRTLEIKMTNRYDKNDNLLFHVDDYRNGHYVGDYIWTYEEIKLRKNIDGANLIWLDEELQQKSKIYDYDDDDIF